MVKIGRATRSSSRRKQHQRRPFWRSFFVGIGVTFLIILVSQFLEASRFGEWLQGASYDFIQFKLRNKVPPKELPVVVVNIGELPGQKSGVEDGKPTPRQNLGEMLDALYEANAAAVAIYIDFSPDRGAAISPQDQKFLKKCADFQRTRMPVFVGVRRRLDYPAAEWFEDEGFSSMAVNLAIPKGRPMLESGAHDADESPTGVRQMPNAITLLSHRARGASRPPEPANGYASLRSLSSALADSEVTSNTTPKVKLHTPLYSADEVFFIPVEGGDEWKVEMFFVNFGALESIKENTIGAVDGASILAHKSLFNKKLVILGDAGMDQADKHSVPDRHVAVPGVYIHASAVWTLTRNPIYNLTRVGHVATDLFFAVCLLVGVLKSEKKSGEVWVPVFLCLSALVVGVLSVRFTHIIWDDFPFVIVGIFFHTKIERALHLLWERAVEFLRRQRRAVARMSSSGTISCLLAIALVAWPGLTKGVTTNRNALLLSKR